METQWEAQLVDLLTELSAVQDEMLDVLREKRAALAAASLTEIAEISQREEALLARLQACHLRRTELLEEASAKRLPSASLGALAATLPAAARKPVELQIHRAGDRAQLLRHQSLTNWVVVQRSLLHISQLLEIIATGGRLKPTYGKGAQADSSGALVDRAA